MERCRFESCFGHVVIDIDVEEAIILLKALMEIKVSSSMELEMVRTLQTTLRYGIAKELE